MRPRHKTAENDGSDFGFWAVDDCFNEAAAQNRGKLFVSLFNLHS